MKNHQKYLYVFLILSTALSLLNYIKADASESVYKKSADMVSYCINVVDTAGENVEGATVSLTCDGITTQVNNKGNGEAVVDVYKNDDRTFSLTVTCNGYIEYKNNAYKLNTNGYMDIITIAPCNLKSVEDKMATENSAFKILNVTMDGVDLNRNKISWSIRESSVHQLKVLCSGVILGCEVLQNKKVIQRVYVNSNATSAVMYLNNNELTPGGNIGLTIYELNEENILSCHFYELPITLYDYDTSKFWDYRSKEYSQKLAETCALYSTLAYDDVTYNKEESYLATYTKGTFNNTTKSDGVNYLKNVLLQDGYEDIRQFNYGNDEPNDVSYTLARKKVQYNGKGKDLVVVVIRGTDGVEWFGNMDITGSKYDENSSVHYSFKLASDGLKQELESYISSNMLSYPMVMVTGHSRGAAVANLLAKDLTDEKMKYAGVYAYTFATPNCAKDVKNSGKEYNNIYNFCFKDDFVPQIPLKKWGYDKYGITFTNTAEKINLENHNFKWLMKQYTSSLKVEKTTHTNPSFNYQKTIDLIQYIGNKWPTVEEYYNSKKDTATLYIFMRDWVAAVACGKMSQQENIKAGLNILFTGGVYKPVADYFVDLSELGVSQNIVDTHMPAAYYFALITKNFQKNANY